MMTVIEPQPITLYRHVKDAKLKVFVNILEHLTQEVFFIAYSMPMARQSGWFYAALVTGFIA